jgi:hypothetical protein
VYATLAWLVPCYVRNFYGQEKTLGYLLNGFLSGASVILEVPSRRIELAMYCLPRALESFWNILTSGKYKYLRNIPNGEVWLFSMAMGIIMTIYQNERHNMSKTYQGIFIRFFGEN